jgi:phosphoglycerol transferase MdoB-like AlkP superfamily enzyme
MRGSLGTFPLQNEDTNVSESVFINACVPNGLFSLKEAYSEARKEFELQSPERILDEYGYKTIKEAYADLRDIPVDSIQSNDIQNIVFSRVNGTQDKKYNVVLFIMESMSNHLIYFHDNNTNLLGSFEKHFNSDIVFRNFQSSGNGTIITLENILMNVPFHRMFETKYRFNSYDISIAKPFKDAGYRTNFITGIALGWRHLDDVLKRQYFDNVYGKNHILNHFPEAES